MFSCQFVVILKRSTAFGQQLGLVLMILMSGMKVNQWKMLPLTVMNQIGVTTSEMPSRNYMINCLIEGIKQ
jgi:hypothetical protein